MALIDSLGALLIVQCDRCQTRFRLPDTSVGDRGAKARCSRCGNVFIIAKATVGEAPTVAPQASFTAPTQVSGRAPADPFANNFGPADAPAPHAGSQAGALFGHDSTLVSNEFSHQSPSTTRSHLPFGDDGQSTERSSPSMTIPGLGPPPTEFGTTPGTIGPAGGAADPGRPGPLLPDLTQPEEPQPARPEINAPLNPAFGAEVSGVTDPGRPHPADPFHSGPEPFHPAPEPLHPADPFSPPGAAPAAPGLAGATLQDVHGLGAFSSGVINAGAGSLAGGSALDELPPPPPALASIPPPPPSSPPPPMSAHDSRGAAHFEVELPPPPPSAPLIGEAPEFMGPAFGMTAEVSQLDRETVEAAANEIPGLLTGAASIQDVQEDLRSTREGPFAHEPVAPEASFGPTPSEPPSDGGFGVRTRRVPVGQVDLERGKRTTRVPVRSFAPPPPASPKRWRGALIEVSAIALAVGVSFLGFELLGPDAGETARAFLEPPPPAALDTGHISDLQARDVRVTVYPGRDGRTLLVVSGHAKHVGFEPLEDVRAVVHVVDGIEPVARREVPLGLSLTEPQLARIANKTDHDRELAASRAEAESTPGQIGRGETRDFRVVFWQPPEAFEHRLYRVEFVSRAASARNAAPEKKKDK